MNDSTGASAPNPPKPDFIADVVLKMGHDINHDTASFHRSPAWPGNALNELTRHYHAAVLRQAEAVNADLLAACRAFLNAPRSEHLAVRLNEAEMVAVEAIRAAIAKAEGGAS